MAKQMMHLVFPQNMIKKPVIFTMAKKYDIMPNIRRAKITDAIGEMTLELNGSKENLEKARRYLEKVGIKVEPVLGDVIE